MHHVLFMLICVIWGSSFVLMKKAHAIFGPLTIGVWRVAGGAAALYVLWHVLGKRKRDSAREPWPVRLGDVPALLVPVCVGFAYPFVMQPLLIGRYQDSSFFGMMVSLVPLLTMAVSVPMLGQYPRPRQVVGVLLGLVCMVLLSGVGQTRGISLRDLGLAMSVPLAYALSNTFVKRRFAQVSPMALTCTGLAMAGVVLWPMAEASETVSSAGPAEMAVAVGQLLILGVLGTGVATYFFYRLIQSHGPLYAGMVTYVVPMGALAWGWADGEAITAAQVAALVGILLAVGLVQRQ